MSTVFTKFFYNGRALHYYPENIIIRAGDTPSGVYLISKGWVKVYTLSKEGEEVIIMTLRAGEIFPLAWAITGQMTDVTYAALDDTLVQRIPHDSFTDTLRNDPIFSNACMGSLSAYYDALTTEISNLQYHTAREKIILRLLYLAQHFGFKRNDGTVITQHVSNSYLAHSTNMARETASREISHLKRAGMIKSENDYLILKDVDALQQQAGDYYSAESSLVL